MAIVKFKNFINLTEEEKLLVLEWHNSDRVRLKMTNQDIIPLENHLRFIESLKTRTNCKYWLFMIDDVPVGVYDIVDIKPDGTGGVGGSYIGDVSYLGYGLLLVYLTIVKSFDSNSLNSKEEIVKENCTYVMKNNPRTYKMHKKVFGAKDFCEDDEKWYIYWDKEGWDSVKDNLKETIYDPLNITEVIWEG